jgi:hypothetical protein
MGRHRDDPKNAGKGDKDHRAEERAGPGVRAAASAGYPVEKGEGNCPPRRNKSATAFTKPVSRLNGYMKGKSRRGVRRGKPPYAVSASLAWPAKSSPYSFFHKSKMSPMFLILYGSGLRGGCLSAEGNPHPITSGADLALRTVRRDRLTNPLAEGHELAV